MVVLRRNHHLLLSHLVLLFCLLDFTFYFRLVLERLLLLHASLRLLLVLRILQLLVTDEFLLNQLLLMSLILFSSSFFLKCLLFSLRL